MLKGINWDATIALADAISIPVIASGGLASIDDVKAHDCSRARRSSKARSPAARSTTGGSTPREALALIRAARAA